MIGSETYQKCLETVADILDKVIDQERHGTECGREGDKSWSQEIVDAVVDGLQSGGELR
jgi:hypothetical protein